MLSREEYNRLIVVYDVLIQLYVLRDQARKAQNVQRLAILEYEIAAVELRWQVLREKRKGSFN